MQAINGFYGVQAQRLLRQYQQQPGGFANWDQHQHAKDWLLFAQNLGPQLPLDETSLSHGELYTILTNKAAQGGKGALVAIVAGTKPSKSSKSLNSSPSVSD